MRYVRILLAALAFVLSAATVGAQNPIVNPSEVIFTSPDHAIATDYEVGYFLAGASVPVQSQKFPKPALGADGDVHLTVNSRALALGQYETRVRAWVGTPGAAGSVVSGWGGGGPLGDQSVPFARVLSQPFNLRMR
jgi:hypothetical protein